MGQSGKVIDLRRRARSEQPSLFSPRDPRAPESPKRPLSLRARRRRIRALFALVTAILIVAAAYGISSLSYLPQFSVSSVSVIGARHIPPQLIRYYVETILDNGSYHILSRNNIFVYPRAVIEKAVVTFFPRIKSAKVSRASLLATTVTVEVREREPFARWCLPRLATSPSGAGADSLTRCYAMDDGGFIFAEEGGLGTSTTQYVFEGGLPAGRQGIATSTDSTPSTSSGQAGPPQANPIGQTFVRAHLPGLVSLLQLLGQAGFNPRGASVWSDLASPEASQGDQDFSIPLLEGFVLKASFGQDANTLVKNLELVLSSETLRDRENELEYVDLRFGNRVYYKLRGEGQQSTQ